MTDQIFNSDCITGASQIKDGTIDLMVCDPPFGINESSFDKHYKRNKDKIIDGYHEAPVDYLQFSRDWLKEAYRVLKPDGSIYVISGHSRLLEILQAAQEAGFILINHIIWKFNFGVYTKKKFVTSHYHVIYMKKSENAIPTFIPNCRFGSHEVDENGGKLQYQDMEDVWCIKKEYAFGEEKNNNKLPEELVRKMIQYSSNVGDVVCDFFLGNFTTAVVAKKLKRIPMGFELNKDGFDHHMERLKSVQPNEEWLKKPEDKSPKNRGKKISATERAEIKAVYKVLRKEGKTKKDAMAELCNRFERGYWGVIRVIEKSGGDMELEQEKEMESRTEGVDFNE